VVVWKKQAETADKVTASLSTSDPDAPPMKLEDLEGHLNALKEMFIQKQKMMDDLEKTTEVPTPTLDGPPPAVEAPAVEAPAAAT